MFKNKNNTFCWLMAGIAILNLIIFFFMPALIIEDSRMIWEIDGFAYLFGGKTEMWIKSIKMYDVEIAKGILSELPGWIFLVSLLISLGAIIIPSKSGNKEASVVSGIVLVVSSIIFGFIAFGGYVGGVDWETTDCGVGAGSYIYLTINIIIGITLIAYGVKKQKN